MEGSGKYSKGPKEKKTGTQTKKAAKGRAGNEEPRANENSEFTGFGQHSMRGGEGEEGVHR